jgi:hypothetical protein
VIGSGHPNDLGNVLAEAMGDLHHAGPNQFLYSADAYPGRIYKMTLDGKVRGTIGGPVASSSSSPGCTGITCPSENVLYVAELLSWRVQKLLLHCPGTRGPGRRRARRSAQVLELLHASARRSSARRLGVLLA